MEGSDNKNKTYILDMMSNKGCLTTVTTLQITPNNTAIKKQEY